MSETDSLKRVVWASWEDNIIKEYYPILGNKIIKFLPNRTEGAIFRRAKVLGVKRIYSNM